MSSEHIIAKITRERRAEMISGLSTNALLTKANKFREMRDGALAAAQRSLEAVADADVWLDVVARELEHRRA